MKPPAISWVLCLVLAAGAATAGGEGAGNDLKEKRAALKKRLAEIEAADQGQDAGAVTKAAGLLPEVRAAGSQAAAQALVQLAATCRHDQLFRAAKAELGKLKSEEAIRYLAAVLKPKEPAAAKRIPWEARALAAEVLGTIDHPLAIEALVSALKDPDPLVLLPVIISAGKKEDRRVIPPLIEVVRRFTKQGGPEYERARQSLVDLTGEDFFTAEKWKEWWDSRQDGFDFKKKGGAKEAKTRVVEKKPGFVGKTASFFGTEIRSTRLLFVIDISGSMMVTDPPQDPLDPELVKKMQDEPPKPELQRIERAKRELTEAIKNLDGYRNFDVLAFSNVVRVWKPDLVPASEENKKNALEFVKNLRENGGTFTDDAFRRAFQLRDVDTIYFLSDGAPQKDVGNPGEDNLSKQRITIAACLDLIQKETRFRKVTVHSFGLCGLGVFHKKWGQRPRLMPLDPEQVKPFREFMEEVAKRTGGQFKAI